MIGFIVSISYAENDIENELLSKMVEIVKNTAGWWATEEISDAEFLNAIEFLVNNSIIQIDSLPNVETSKNIPQWIKNAAGWWATEEISDVEFLNAIKFLINSGIIIIETNDNEKDTSKGTIEYLDDLSFLEQIVIPDKQSTHFINSYGFRSPEIPEEKPSDTFRVILVGGSTMYGSGVNDQNTIPALLQKKFNLESNKKIEIINAGVSGATSLTETKLIKEKLVKFSPDLILVYDGFNDIKRYFGENVSLETSVHSEKWLSPIDWKKRWIELCKLGDEHNFQTIVTLQPFLSTGDKLHTDKEKSFTLAYKFTEILSKEYHMYAEELSEIDQNCSAAYDLRYIFDDYLGGIYWDYVHVGNSGNEIVAEIFYKIIDNHILNTNYENDITEYSKQKNNFRELLLEKIGGGIFDVNVNDKNFFGLHISNQDFSNMDLHGANFRHSTLENTDFTNSNLSDSVFGSANLKNIDFTGSDLSNINANNIKIDNSLFVKTKLNGANFLGGTINCSGEMNFGFLCFNDANLENADFSSTSLMNLDFSNSKIYNTKFINNISILVNFPDGITADFSGAKLPQSEFKGDLDNVVFGCSEFWCSDFSNKSMKRSSGLVYASGTNLSNTDLSKRDLSNLVFNTYTVNDIYNILSSQENYDFFSKQGTKLRFSNLSETKFIGNDLKFVDFTGSDLSFSNLSDTDLRYVDLTGANLTGANLTSADLTGADLTGAIIDGGTVLESAILNCIGHEVCTGQ